MLSLKKAPYVINTEAVRSFEDSSFNDQCKAVEDLLFYINEVDRNLYSVDEQISFSLVRDAPKWATVIIGDSNMYEDAQALDLAIVEAGSRIERGEY